MTYTRIVYLSIDMNILYLIKFRNKIPYIDFFKGLTYDELKIHKHTNNG